MAVKSLILDLETTTTGPKPDFRVDEVTQVGWLPLDGDVAQWSECFCPLGETWHYNTPFVMHSAMYDLGLLVREAYDGDPLGWSEFLHTVEVHDTLALAYAQGKQDLSLKGLGASELGVVTVPFNQRHLIGEEQYLAQDLFLTRDLLKKLLPLNQGTAYDIDRALIPALIDCSYRGYEVDQDRLEDAVTTAKATRDRMELAFGKMTEGTKVLISRHKKTTKRKGTEYVEKHGRPSVGSPAQISRLLKVDGTDKETLQAIASVGGDAGIIAEITLRYRRAEKALTTYFYPLQGVERLTGLFNITPNEDMEGGTGTGRLSSERANLQNQPPAVQRCLRAPEGFLLRRGDYPQIELRCAAEISDDPTMIEALANPERDLHQETADRLFNGDRQRGKVFNFKELYIAGPAVKEAYPRFYEWAQEHWSEVQRTSYSVSPEPFLHRRFIPLLAGDHARRMAINHPVQCVRFGTRILTADLQWLPVEELHDGDKLIAFDEDNPAPHRRRQWKYADVTYSDPTEEECYEVQFSDGRKITTTAEHMWLACNRQGHTRWVRTDSLLRGKPSWVPAIFPGVWGYDTSNGAGYLAGAFDCDGTVTRPTPRQGGLVVRLSQKPNEVTTRTLSELAARSFRFRNYFSEGAKVGVTEVVGGVVEQMRFLGSTRPGRLLRRFDVTCAGGLATRGRRYVQVVAVRPVGLQPIVQLATSTATFFAEGLPCHNSMAVYITKVAMNELFQAGSLLVNQVHDSIHDYVPADGDQDLQARIMAGIMESVMQEYLPRVGNAPVDVKISRYWEGA